MWWGWAQSQVGPMGRVQPTADRPCRATAASRRPVSDTSARPMTACDSPRWAHARPAAVGMRPNRPIWMAAGTAHERARVRACLRVRHPENRRGSARGAGRRPVRARVRVRPRTSSCMRACVRARACEHVCACTCVLVRVRFAVMTEGKRSAQTQASKRRAHRRLRPAIFRRAKNGGSLRRRPRDHRPRRRTPTGASLAALGALLGQPRAVRASGWRRGLRKRQWQRGDVRSRRWLLPDGRCRR